MVEKESPSWFDKHATEGTKGKRKATRSFSQNNRRRRRVFENILELAEKAARERAERAEKNFQRTYARLSEPNLLEDKKSSAESQLDALYRVAKIVDAEEHHRGPNDNILTLKLEEARYKPVSRSGIDLLVREVLEENSSDLQSQYEIYLENNLAGALQEASRKLRKEKAHVHF